MKNYTVKNDVTPSVSDAIELYVSVGWGKEANYNTSRFEKAFQNSLFITAHSDDGKLLGITRILSDNAHETHVCEFLVHPEYQGMGIGKTMLASLIERFGHTDIYANTPEKYEAFFTSHGMKVQNYLNSVSRRAA